MHFIFHKYFFDFFIYNYRISTEELINYNHLKFSGSTFEKIDSIIPFIKKKERNKC